MRPGERTVAGLTCSEVLQDLSAYLDRELPVDRATRLEAHVADCQLCANFGAGFAALLTQVRERFRGPDPVPDDVVVRLREVLLTQR